MLFLGLLMPLALLLAACVVRPHTDGWRDAGLLAGVLVGLGLVAVTEAASALGAVTFPVLVVTWGGACLGLVAAAWRRPPGPLERPAMTRELVALTTASIALIGLVLALGVAVAPNNYDSMVYHLTRVAQWAQAGTIEHFPTWCARQLYSNPFAELVILHTYVLTGGDRLANAVQGAALVGAVVGVSVIARRVGLGPLGQAWSALFAATLPGALAQGQTTQNDLVVAALLMTAGAFGLDVARGRTGWVQLSGWGGALGLAFLTKGTAFLLAPLLLAAPAVALVRRSGRAAALPLAAAGLLALAPSLGHWSRNVMTFGAPLVPAEDQRLFRLETLAPPAVISNAVRIAASHVELPSAGLTRALESSIRRAHDLTGVDPDDPRTTFPGARFEVRRWRAHEDKLASPWHMLLALVAIVIVLRRGEHRGVRIVVVAAALAMVAVALLLKWQPWMCRLTLPVAVGLAPVAAAVVEAHLTARQRGLLAVAAVLHAVHVLTLLEGHELVRPRYRFWPLALARDVQYFSNDPGGLPPPLLLASDWLRRQGVRRVSVVAGVDELEYPLWALLGPEVHVEHVCPWPELATGHLRGAAQAPADHVVCLDDGKVERLRALGWREVFAAERVTIWRP